MIKETWACDTRKAIAVMTTSWLVITSLWSKDSQSDKHVYVNNKKVVFNFMINVHLIELFQKYLN